MTPDPAARDEAAPDCGAGVPVAGAAAHAGRWAAGLDPQMLETVSGQLDDDASFELSIAAHLLTTPTALAELEGAEAEFVIGYTHEQHFAAGEVVIAEGTSDDTGCMYLILDGDVTVESVVVSRTDPIIVSALGPGSLIGEMGLLDGAPRAASCIAATDVTVAVLTREALARLILDAPAVGAKLLAAISQRMAERLRESGRKLRAYSQLVRAMQDEIESLDPTPSRYRVTRGSPAD
jgi:CRP-like cAMP-binding protein